MHKLVARFSATFITSLVTILGLAAPGLVQAAAGTVYVGKTNCSDSGPGTQQMPYCTIQKGVNSVASGGTVRIAAGTYAEQVVLPKGTDNIVLKGSGFDTIIQAPSTLTSGKIVDIQDNGSTIENLTVSGPFNSNSCASDEYGVFFENKTSGTIKQAQVVNIGEADQTNYGGCQQGVAIRVGSNALGIKASATIMQSKISGYQKGGIVVDGSGSTATIQQNAVNGGSASNLIARNGIQVSRQATATVKQNDVSNNSYTGDNGVTTAAGILVYDAGKVNVGQNSSHANDIGIDVEGTSNGNYGQNSTNDNTTNGIFVEDDNYTNPPQVFASSGNVFRQNNAHNNTGNNAYTPYDMEDDTTGSGTLGTANTWVQNVCQTSKPDKLCVQ